MDKNDIYALREKRNQIILNIKNYFGISESKANDIIEYLEKEDFFKIVAPKIKDKATEVLMSNKHFLKSELGVKSRKPGNIILNTYLNWENLAAFIASLIPTICGLAEASPVAIASGIIGAIFSVTSLMDIELNETSTAIILGLQKYNCFNNYYVTKEQCKLDANKILQVNNYDEMSSNKYEDELFKLDKIGCIEIDNGMVKLKEKIIVKY